MATGESIELIVAHAKSKGIFNAVDQVHLQRESDRNRRKLLGECESIRRRVDQRLDAGDEVVVMGDINDGPGMDFHEMKFGRSAVEIIMGDLFEPDRILRAVTGRPTFGRFGWVPASARFRDRITGDFVSVLIDHILISARLHTTATNATVWNPFQHDPADAQRQNFLDASDHFPITVDLQF